MISETLKSKLITLPMEPGCYMMKNKNNEIIYVGKAKKLKNRVNQYFVGVHNYKTTKLVSEICDFETIVTTSEKEALLLEINLIKKHRPKYNIMFMDDKSYPYIKLSSGKYPTCTVVRDAKKDRKAHYFGPFPDATAAYQTMKLLNQLYPLRKCKNMPDKVCLYYHLKQCLGPCQFEVSPEEYNQLIEQVTAFLKGDVKDLLKELREKMAQEAEALEFEKAQATLELIHSIEHISDRQSIQVEDRKDRDVFAYYEDKGYIAIQGLLVRSGTLLEREFTVSPLYDEAEDSFVSFLLQYYQNHPYPKEIIIPENIDLELLKELLGDKIIQPQRGYRKKLLEMAKINAKKNCLNQFETLDYQRKRKENCIEELKRLCSLEELDRIEIFDNSHLSGQFTVAGMVVYQNLQFAKGEYRHYKLHTANSDVDSMKEVLYRRYFRALNENSRLPDLLLVDGGITQINAAKEILSSLGLEIPLFGLVKDDKHNTSGLMDKEGRLIEIDRSSEAFFLLTNLQDEVHRFAISYHRKLRSKAQTQSILDEVEGIGVKRKKQLLNHFRSFKKIKEASIEELTEILPSDVAKRLFDVLH